jgi:hypothetical protein
VLLSDGITSLQGTTGAQVNALNATPASVAPPITWGPYSVMPGGFSFNVPSTPTTIGPFTATSGAAPPVLFAGTLLTTLTIFGNPYLATCVPPAPGPEIAAARLSLSTAPSATSIVASTPGGLTDTATLTGTASLGSPTGSVRYYVCGPHVTSCSSSGTPVGAGPVPVMAGSDSTASATSAVLATPSEPGEYCFDAKYSGDTNYPVAEDGATGGCFVVTAPIPCAPSCTGSITSTEGSSVVTGSSTSPGNMYLEVGQSTLNCGKGRNAAGAVTTLQEGNFSSSAPLTITDTVAGLTTAQHFGVCFQTLTGTFLDSSGHQVTTGLLRHCRGTTPTVPCLKSATEVGGSVVSVFLVPPNDPRYHPGGLQPVVKSVSPGSGAPGVTVTIKGSYLTGAQVRVGQFAVAARVSKSKIVLTMPSTLPAETLPITISTPSGTTVCDFVLN